MSALHSSPHGSYIHLHVGVAEKASRSLLRGDGAGQGGAAKTLGPAGSTVTSSTAPPGPLGRWPGHGLRLFVNGAEEPLREPAQLGGCRPRLLLQTPVVLPQVTHLCLEGRLILLLLPKVSLQLPKNQLQLIDFASQC